MRLFTDENIPRSVVTWLQDQGHDVRHAAEISPGAEDLRWLQVSDAGRRVLITSDKDFGDLVFRDNGATNGVILLRLRDMTPMRRIARLAEAWPEIEAAGHGHFIVVTPTRVRVRTVEPPSNPVG